MEQEPKPKPDFAKPRETSSRVEKGPDGDRVWHDAGTVRFGQGTDPYEEILRRLVQSQILRALEEGQKND